MIQCELNNHTPDTGKADHRTSCTCLLGQALRAPSRSSELLGQSTDYLQLPKVPLNTEKCMLATKIN